MKEEIKTESGAEREETSRIQQARNSIPINKAPEMEELSRKRKSPGPDEHADNVESSEAKADEVPNSKRARTSHEFAVGQLPYAPSDTGTLRGGPSPIQSMEKILAENHAELAPDTEPATGVVNMASEDPSSGHPAAATVGFFLDDDLDLASDWDGFPSEGDVGEDVTEGKPSSGMELNPAFEGHNIMEDEVMVGGGKRAAGEEGDEEHTGVENRDDEQAGGQIDDDGEVGMANGDGERTSEENEDEE